MTEVKLSEQTLNDIREMPLVDLAYQILAATSNEPLYYRDLMKKIADMRGMTSEEVEESIARLYTDINVDGRFLCIGDNVWGLRRWYPVERLTERGTSKRFMRKDRVSEDTDEADIDDEFDLEEELVEEEPFVFEDEDTLEDGDLAEDELEFIEESDMEEELDGEDSDDEDSEDF